MESIVKMDNVSGEKVGKSKVCRCLFGKPDRTKDVSLSKKLSSVFHKDRIEGMSRWGFDVLTDNPCEGGRYQWDVVDASEVPEFYTKEYKSKTQVRVVRSSLDNLDVKCTDNESSDVVQRVLSFGADDVTEEVDGTAVCSSSTTSRPKKQGKLVQSHLDGKFSLYP